MWKNIELKPREGLFLMRNGSYLEYQNILQEDKYDIIGYCLDNTGLIASVNVSDPMIWSIEYNDIPRLNKYNSHKWKCGIDNTRYIVDYCKDNNKDIKSTYPATYYCTSFSPGYRDGEWYLPSASELGLLYYNNGGKFIHKLFTLELSKLYNVLNYNNDSWSSTVYDCYIIYAVKTNSYGEAKLYSLNKLNHKYVIPFLTVNEG